MKDTATLEQILMQHARVDHRVINWFDGWNAKPTGDDIADFASGERHAEEVIKHARSMNDPRFVFFVLASLDHSARSGGHPRNGIEAGFLARLARLAYAGALN